MKKTAIIPLRKGSKSIIGKNKRKMVGRPLFTWVLKEAIFSNLDEVIVFTDDLTIIEFIEKEYTWTPKVKAILRNDENANDTASTESVLLEFSELVNYKYDILCLLQATSPLTTSESINDCLNSIVEKKYDASLTVVNTHRFTWNTNGTPQNYDVFNRPRRQDFEGLLIENGAVYCTTKTAFINSKNRVSGKIKLVYMPEDSLVEIDSMTDWLIVEELLINRLKKQKNTNKITHVVLDVDGVFTDGTVSFTKDGEHTKSFDMRDGMGLEILRGLGIEVLVMTSEKSELVAARMKKLQIDQVYLGVKDKFALLQQIRQEKQITLGNIAYVGDDVNDLANICSVGWSIAPYNATNIVKQNADTVLTKNSGSGAIREACEFILNYNKRF
ncbi:acylneuraminate cytidylyltransferase [Wenyingzhuangia aestuarii]|uniref:acylneuraminate cytidylyltransferase n=1 Tax=Wenyingzhuangia aestuarii TaxID=1647582 RepID=UPI0014398917|nr:acylneuraminate cytidylyltransferase [Wenyingzhuangia aestuarii]NJB81742.1 N-acylneuraminate cytidylyltransferase [Wenyingzhuangia aestuarii]